jgi:lantibiotic leader peptide-processing serine protease
VLPPDFVEECDTVTGQCASYAWVQGTSMATPNAAGVAALIISQYGDFDSNNQNKPHMAPTQVESILQITANNQPCPEPATVRQGPGVGFAPTGPFFEFATCQGSTTGGNGDGYTNFFGKGIVDALNAVTFYNNSTNQ